MDNPRGVSSNHVLSRAFGDAYCRRENVRHATLLFCAEGVNVRTTGAEEMRAKMTKRLIGIVALIGVAMPLVAADKSDEEIRQEKEMLFWASLSPSERDYQKSLKVKADAKPRMKAARRIVSANATAIAPEPSITVTEVKQREGTYGVGAIVDVTYNLLNTEHQCKVEAKMTNDGVEVASPSIDPDGDIGGGVQPGEGKHFAWNVGKDWPNQHSDKFKVTLTATETDVSAEWATVTISWSSGRDVDICAYWEDAPSQKVGYSYISSGSSGFDTLKWPSGDNTGGGPEQVYCDVGGRATRILRIYFNYFGTAGSPAEVGVTAKNNNVTKSVKCVASTSTGRAANTGDPGVSIVFDASNTPVSITKSNQ